MEENNKLIAEFMGLELTTDGISDLYYTKDKRLKRIENYHKSWDCLMLVVEKINTMDNFNYSVSINYHCTSITDNDTLYDIVDESADGNTIEGCYRAVIEFIKWHNKTKLKQDGKYEG